MFFPIFGIFITDTKQPVNALVDRTGPSCVWIDPMGVSQVEYMEYLLKRAAVGPAWVPLVVHGDAPASVEWHPKHVHFLPGHERLESELRGADIHLVHELQERIGVDRHRDAIHVVMVDQSIVVSPAGSRHRVGVRLDQNVGLGILVDRRFQHFLESGLVRPAFTDCIVSIRLVDDKHLAPARTPDLRHKHRLMIVFGQLVLHDPPHDPTSIVPLGGGDRQRRIV